MAIASATDHFARKIAGGSKHEQDCPVIGLLFGIRSNNIVSLHEATDVFIEKAGTKFVVAESDIQKKIQLLTAVFTNYELLGWYIFSESITTEHLFFHSIISKFCANPIFLLFHGAVNADIDTIPLSLFTLAEVDGKQSFIASSYRIESSDVENIAIDEIMKSLPTHGISLYENKNKVMINSLNVLASKIDILLHVMNGMQNGEIPADQALLRAAAKICHTLEALSTTDQVVNANKEYLHNSLLNSSVAMTIKNLQQAHEIHQLLNMIHDQRSAI